MENFEQVKKFFNEIPHDVYVDLFSDVENFLKQNKDIKRYAVRSSQLYEDGNDNSFSGLFYTKLNLSHVSDIVNAIVKCWRESFNIGVIEYSKKNEKFKAIPCSVIIQQFIFSNKSGVIFKLEDNTVLDCNYGLAKSIVDGNTGCDEWIISNKTKKILDYSNNKEFINIPITKRINPAENEEIIYQNYNGLFPNEFNNTDNIIEVKLTNELKEKQTLNNDEIKDILDISEKISEILNIKYYDIEWTYDEKGNLYILQCRPLTRLFNTLKLDNTKVGEFGIGLVNGEAIGKAIKVYDSKTAMQFEDGCILVTKRLSGNTLIAASKAKGCMIESKSPLSHSAIIARELGIPVIGNVSIDAIIEGKTYYINGRTGEYKIKNLECNNKKSINYIGNEKLRSKDVKEVILKTIYKFKNDLFNRRNI